MFTPVEILRTNCAASFNLIAFITLCVCDVCLGGLVTSLASSMANGLIGHTID